MCQRSYSSIDRDFSLLFLFFPPQQSRIFDDFGRFCVTKLSEKHRHCVPTILFDTFYEFWNELIWSSDGFSANV
uniref:Uncharacterized protein n=1 Tax=Lepeophtheirus salmonis TaxID=72036 RepID=A0A0K2VCD6_LEPSM